MILRPFVGTQRVTSPPGKVGQPSGSESCVVVEQSTLRSVDSEWAGRVIEPRNQHRGGSRRCPLSGRQHRSAAVAERGGPAGVEEQGTFIVRSSRNLGGPVVSVERTGCGESGEQPLACGCCALRPQERSPRRSGGSAERRQRSDAEGRQEVGVPGSTGEAGEPTRGTPWREGGTGTRERSRERWRRHRAPQPYQRNSGG